MRALILALALTGCMTGANISEGDEADLARELEGHVAGAPQRCVSVSQTDSLQIVSADTLVLRQGATIWVNRLDGNCPGLRPLHTLVVQPSLSGQYCRNDRVRALEPGSSIPGPICPLGDFTPYRRR